MKNVLIGGIGNVLLGDDGVGPYVLRLLESRYEFEEGVELADLGTPALDLLNRISGRDAVILIDCVDSKSTPGSVLIYRKPDLIRHSPGVRTDPHSPAITEILLSADFWGVSPGELLLVGITPESFESGCALSDSVNASLDDAVARVLSELDRLHIKYKPRKKSGEPNIWWTENQAQVISH